MAKGDAEAARQETDYQKKRFESQVNPVISTASGAYESAVPRQISDYKNIMGGYRNFAENGGFSPEDINAIRSRAMSPARSAATTAMNEISRQRALQGGYSPNATAALASLGRGVGQNMSDASLNTEAMIAQLLQSGKLAGLGGMTGIYGASPGMASSFGNQVMNAIGTSGNFGNNTTANRIQIGSMPSGWDNFMKTMSGLGALAGGASNLFAPGASAAVSGGI